MQCMLGPARKCIAMHRLPLFSFLHSSGGCQNLSTASLDAGRHHRLNGTITGSVMWPSAIGEAIGRERIAGRHLTLPVGRMFLQDLQLIATEGKAEHGNTIQGIYAPIMSLIMFVTQKGMCLDSRTTNHAFPCMMAQRIKYATFMSNEMQTIQTNQGPIPITNSRNKALWAARAAVSPDLGSESLGPTLCGNLDPISSSSVFIRALYTFNSVVGRSAKPAIEAAVDDVNSDSTVLAGMKLNLILHDKNCSVFLGIVEALQLMENVVVAVIGPQSSGIVHVISHVVNKLHVPLLSFAAIDPMHSALQCPYCLRTTHNDYFQIRNGISVLGDAVAKKHAKISYKAAFTPGASRNDINDLLVRVNMMESRVYVVHVNPGSSLTIFSTAKLLQMLIAGYIWIAAD
ncbi:hypothetical protein HYC85_011303 [Camellia sinensis]|uniref:Receptor ligand binding region domain-containing protein n=1 Tax=Camellia sinensis TaxID=4442 RepID=A0A7J7H8Q2_CAMSI|nr:hypothetical protein HYC85_011303 [Camellia sinensis]